MEAHHSQPEMESQPEANDDFIIGNIASGVWERRIVQPRSYSEMQAVHVTDLVANNARVVISICNALPDETRTMVSRFAELCISKDGQCDILNNGDVFVGLPKQCFNLLVDGLFDMTCPAVSMNKAIMLEIEQSKPLEERLMRLARTYLDSQSHLHLDIHGGPLECIGILKAGYWLSAYAPLWKLPEEYSEESGSISGLLLCIEALRDLCFLYLRKGSSDLKALSEADVLTMTRITDGNVRRLLPLFRPSDEGLRNAVHELIDESRRDEVYRFNTIGNKARVVLENWSRSLSISLCGESSSTATALSKDALGKNLSQLRKILAPFCSDMITILKLLGNWASHGGHLGRSMTETSLTTPRGINRLEDFLRMMEILREILRFSDQPDTLNQQTLSFGHLSGEVSRLILNEANANFFNSFADFLRICQAKIEPVEQRRGALWGPLLGLCEKTKRVFGEIDERWSKFPKAMVLSIVPLRDQLLNVWKTISKVRDMEVPAIDENDFLTWSERILFLIGQFREVVRNLEAIVCIESSTDNRNSVRLSSSMPTRSTSRSVTWNSSPLSKVEPSLQFSGEASAVFTWIEQNIGRKYAESIVEEHEVRSFEVLCALSAEDWREMGIAKVGTRRALLSGIETLKQHMNPDDSENIPSVSVSSADPLPSTETENTTVPHSPEKETKETSASGSHIPPPPVNFVGRRSEENQIKKFLSSRAQDTGKSATVIVISGVGGVGKSGLARKVAQDMISKYNVQYYVDLMGAREEERLPLHTAMAVVLREHHNVAFQPPATVPELTVMYRRCFSGQTTLLLLDDAGSAADVRALVPVGEDICAIITSRMDLCTELEGHFPSVVSYALRGLDDVSAIEYLSRSIPNLFGSEMDEDTQKLASRVANLCGGIPLALELASGILRGRRRHSGLVASRMTRLVDRLEKQRAKYFDAVFSGFMASYSHLSPSSQRMLIALAVFPASFAVDDIGLILREARESAEEDVNKLGYRSRITGAAIERTLMQAASIDFTLCEGVVQREIKRIEKRIKGKALDPDQLPAGSLMDEHCQDIDAQFQEDEDLEDAFEELCLHSFVDSVVGGLPGTERSLVTSEGLGVPSGPQQSWVGSDRFILHDLVREFSKQAAKTDIEALGGGVPNEMVRIWQLRFWRRIIVSLNEAQELFYEGRSSSVVRKGLLQASIELPNLSLLRDMAKHPTHAYIFAATFRASDVLAAVAGVLDRISLYESVADTLTARGTHDVPLDCLGVLSWLAYGWKDYGQYSKAEPLFEKVLEMRKVALGDRHELVATAYADLAWLKFDTGHYDIAHTLFKRSLWTWKLVLVDRLKDLAEEMNMAAAPLTFREPSEYLLTQSFDDLAVLLMDQENVKFTPELARKRAASSTEQPGGKSPDMSQSESWILRKKNLIHGQGASAEPLAHALDGLATLLRNQGRYKEAEQFYWQALRIRETALGPDHLLVATTLNSMGTLQAYIGRYAEAEVYYQRAISIRKSALSDKHPHTAWVYDNLATLYSILHRYAEAEQLFQLALDIHQATVGTFHPSVAWSTAGLGALYRDWNPPHIRESLPFSLFHRALQINQVALGNEHENVSRVMGKMALLLQKRGRIDEALPMLERALSIQEKALGPDHHRVGITLNRLADMLISLGKLDRAKSLLERSVKIHEAVLSAEHPASAQTRRLLSGVNSLQALSGPVHRVHVIKQ